MYKRRPGAQGPRWSSTASGCRSALDNRPLRLRGIREAHAPVHLRRRPRRPTTRSTHAGQVVEQVVRPTGLVDPEVEVRPATRQVDDAAAGDPHARRRRTSACWSPRSPSAWPSDLTDYLAEQRREGALPAQRRRHGRAGGDHPRPAPGRPSTCWWASTCCARGSTFPSVAGGHPGRRQGRLPARRALADPDHRPGGAQPQRQGHPVRRPDDRFDEAAPSARPSAGARAKQVRPQRSATASRARSIVKQVRDLIDGVYSEKTGDGDGQAGPRARRRSRT